MTEAKSSTRNRVAVSLGLPNTALCLTMLHGLSDSIGMAEIRLDLMESFDLRQLIRESPCPLIITCRPTREGGRFHGGEAERVAILRQAMELGFAYVDIEWDSVAEIRERRGSNTKLIVSRHWPRGAPVEWFSAYDAMRNEADAVKLVGMAERVADVLPVFELLRRAATPVIAIGMGEAGALTRLLAPCFASCLLTYGSASREAITAPGQLTVAEMVDTYKLHLVSPQSRINLHLCANSAAADVVINQNSRARGDSLYLGVVVTPEEVAPLAAGMLSAIPDLNLTIDPSFASSLS